MIFDIKGQVVVVLEFTLGQVIEKDLCGGVSQLVFTDYNDY